MTSERDYWSGKARRVLVGRSRLDKAEWTRMFRRLVVALRNHADDLENPARALEPLDIDPREPLVWAWCVLTAMPPSLLQDYKALLERADDGTGIEDGLEEVRKARYSFDSLDTAHPLRLAWLARLVRTLDADVAQLHYGPEGDRDERWTTDRWRVPGYPCYVIPIDRTHRIQNQKPAVRRALRYHAILPTQVGEHEVRVALPKGQLPPATPSLRDWCLGAAIFDDLQVEVEVEAADREFTVIGVACADQAAKLQAALEAARASRCELLMWPELTVPRAVADEFAAKLRREALQKHHKMRLVIAGSWHLPARKPGRVRNVAPVFDGRGNPVVETEKRMKFSFQGLTERIEPGGRLDVIAAGDRLIAMAICLDFCDDQEAGIYHALDVDTVLVTSMGGQTTIEAHERHAKDLQTLHNATVLVVQQVPVLAGSVRPATEPPGYSAAIPSRTEDEEGAASLGTRQDAEIRILKEWRERTLDKARRRT